MKQFFTVFKFELSGYMKNKLFVGLTIVIVLALALVLSYPRFSNFLDKKDISISGNKKEEVKVISVYNKSDIPTDTLIDSLTTGFGKGYKVEEINSEKTAKQVVKTEKSEAAVVVETQTSYKYIVETNGMYNTESQVVDHVLLNLHRYIYLHDAGLNDDQILTAIDSNIDCETVVTGSDQTQSFLYTYAITMVLYMVLLLYGQFVSSSVASEKSSRAMEVLITSAKPLNLMFGKILGSGCAGLIQLIAIVFSAFGFYKINAAYIDNEIIKAIFDMPISAVLYTILFFILGFFIYAFIYGAAGSLATRTEDLNTLTMPITVLYMVAFFLAIYGMSSGNVDTTIMKVCSYLPTFAPVIMLVRVCMGNIGTYEIIISVAIQLISIVGLGVLCAKIYRAGVLMYGNTPKLKDVFKILKEAKTL